MNLVSIRLKNIRSYGEGSEGQGITVPFHPGINRIAGRNGHGKSTLIESLGYALFLIEPVYEENFQIERYFLRHGAKEGEIDVTFAYNGDQYRVERGVGKQSKRRAKVIQVSDGSICAENDAEVGRFLCRLLQFPNPERLQEMFAKLIGVKQGRLVWPFDSKPSDAKRFFEPLLDVAVFRDCFDRLKPAVDYFKGQTQEHAQKRAGLAAQIRDRTESQQQVAACRLARDAATETLRMARESCAAALRRKGEQELLADAARQAKANADRCRADFANAEKLRQLAGQSLEEAQAAAHKLQQNQAAFTACAEAAAALAQLESKRIARDALRAKLEQAERLRIQSAEKAAAARSQADEYIRQKDGKDKDRSGFLAQAARLQGELECGREAFHKEKAEVSRAGQESKALSAAVTELRAQRKSQDQNMQRMTALARDLAAWDSGKLAQTEAAEVRAREAQDKAKEQLARARERLGTLTVQLQEISGGLCPFLKEPCRQFHPARISADMESCKLQISQFLGEEQSAQAAFAAAKAEAANQRARHSQAAAWRAELDAALSAYAAAARSFPFALVESAATWLVAWEKSIAPMPTAPVLPTGAESVEPFAAFHEQMLAYGEALGDWWAAAERQCAQRTEQFRALELSRQAREREAQTLAAQEAALTKEIQGFENQIAARQAEAVRQEGARDAAQKEIGQWTEALQGYADLDADYAREQQKQTANRPGYEAYLGAKALADQVTSRETALAERRKAEGQARDRLTEALAEEGRATKAFDPANLETARQEHLARHGEAVQWTTTLERQEADLKAAEKRFKEWQDACQALVVVDREIGRCEAAIDLAEAARKTLRDAAPEVARHLCQRIASRAQYLFNRINPEPIELTWEADNYSLRAAPGERRFAMFSGGEQTKLALTMTLAMIEEFCRLRFCIFDEPTYGVDADSRKKLADAILEAQQAAGLEQLLLVSHDDAFEGKIEHSIVLAKSPGLGTWLEG